MPRFTPLAAMFWLAALLVSSAWIFVALNLRSPYLLAFRQWVFGLWLAGGLIAAATAFLMRKSFFSGLHPLHTLWLAALLGGCFASSARWQHYQYRKAVERMTRGDVPEIGKHLMVGWLGYDEVRALAVKGAIAGVFITRGDFSNKTTAAEIFRTIEELQISRTSAGLPRLWIATDQEGGAVEKLSPPLPKQPALASLLMKFDRTDDIIREVTKYAEEQGRALAEVGINMNFAPVVDLIPKHPPEVLDFHSRIAMRALSADPERVALIGDTYVRIMARNGITAILKHFPGLGRVPADTHHFAADLDASVADLDASDWLPFRKLSSQTSAGIMLGHVRVLSLDAENPASCSSVIMRDLLRKQWGVTGLLVTDDFSMTPIFHGRSGIVGAARKSLAAGIDLILLSYEAEAVYDLLGAELMSKTR